jgi:hypothetical protein
MSLKITLRAKGLYRDINENKNSYQLTTNIMKDKKGDPQSYSHSRPDLFVTFTFQLLN